MTGFARKNMLKLSLIFAGLALLPACSYFSRETQQAQPAVAAKTIFSFLGAPGSGKGTLSEQCVTQLGFKTVSTGNLFREEIARGGQRAQLLESYLKTAALVPDEIVVGMVEQWLIGQTGDAPIILDGYPRTRNQARMFADLMKTKFANYHLRVVWLEVTDYEEIVKRISDRLVCEKCQAVYNRALLKDPTNLVCEKCGGKLIQRVDDNEDVVRKRLEIFAKNNAEIVDFYKSVGIAVESINVSHKTPQQIFDDFKRLIA